MAEQRVSVITLASADIARSRRFYGEGFGWMPVFDTETIVFYQLNGIVLGLYRNDHFAADMGLEELPPTGGFAMAHNVREADAVRALMDRLVAAGGRLLREASEPPHGGLRGYVLDPDGNPWEIAFNAGFPIDSEGNVAFGVAEG
jgi:uncharacterized protein